MNRKQINWAMQHDWFVSVNQSKDGVIVRDEYDPNKTLEFTCYKSLRDWAGY